MTQTGILTIDLTADSVREMLHTRLRDLGGTTPGSFIHTFPEPFATAPKVMLGLVGFEAWQGSDTRFRFYLDNVNATSFTVSLSVTNGNSPSTLNLSWLATDA